MPPERRAIPASAWSEGRTGAPAAPRARCRCRCRAHLTAGAVAPPHLVARTRGNLPATLVNDRVADQVDEDLLDTLTHRRAAAGRQRRTRNASPLRTRPGPSRLIKIGEQRARVERTAARYRGWPASILERSSTSSGSPAAKRRRGCADHVIFAPGGASGSPFGTWARPSTACGSLAHVGGTVSLGQALSRGSEGASRRRSSISMREVSSTMRRGSAVRPPGPPAPTRPGSPSVPSGLGSMVEAATRRRRRAAELARALGGVK